MTRHSRNCTAGTVYTYHERQRDTKASGYGSKSARLGKDSMKDFDCCCLTLQPCRDPVVTQEGYLYDKESILEYILKQKKEISRKLKEYEKQMKREKEELAELAKAEEESKKLAFEKANSHASGAKASSSGASGGSICNMKEGKDKELPSFWVPTMTPDAGPLKIEKPARYVCAVTNDVLGNSVPCAVLKTSGSVVTLDCVEKLLRKDMLDPINNKKMVESDIIPLKGASGFSGSGQTLEAKKAGAVLMA